MLNFDGLGVLEFFMLVISIILFIGGLLARKYAGEIGKETEEMRKRSASKQQDF